MPTIGEPFNPWQGACGFYPQDIVGRQKGLTDGQKRLYDRLVRFAGRDGECYPGYNALARELGKSERQIQRDTNKLEDLKLISHRWRDGRKSNVYVFLWHPMFAFERTCVSGQIPEPSEFERTSTSGQNVQSTGSVPEMSGFERTSVVNLSGHPRPPKASMKASGKSSSSSTGPTVKLSSTQASPASEPEMMTDAKTSRPLDRVLLEEAQRHFEIQAGKTPEREKRKSDYTDAQIEQAQRLLADAHGKAPAFEQAKGILEVFQAWEHFHDWLDDLCEQGRNRKLVTFAGYLTDAQRYALRIKENNIEIPEWKGFSFKCKKCFDGGIVETEGESRWCSCETGQQKHASLGDGYLAARMQAAREAEDRLEASLARAREKNKLPEPKPLVVPERTIEASPGNEHRVLEAVSCPHCGGQIVVYSDHIEDCACHGKTRGGLESAGQTLAASGWVQ